MESLPLHIQAARLFAGVRQRARVDLGGASPDEAHAYCRQMVRRSPASRTHGDGRRPRPSHRPSTTPACIPHRLRADSRDPSRYTTLLLPHYRSDDIAVAEETLDVWIEAELRLRELRREIGTRCVHLQPTIPSASGHSPASAVLRLHSATDRPHASAVGPVAHRPRPSPALHIQARSPSSPALPSPSARTSPPPSVHSKKSLWMRRRNRRRANLHTSNLPPHACPLTR